jgi:outer membrane protein TolC
MKECIDLAVRKNLDVKIQNASASIARFDLTGAYSAYMPNFMASARHDFVSQPPDFDPKKATFDNPYELKTDQVSADLKGRVPFGLEYDFDALGMKKAALTDFRLLTNAVEIAPPNGLRYTNNYYSSAGVTLTQHLLRDFWIDSYREIIQLRRKDLKISQYAVEFQIMRTLLSVELAYFQLIASRQVVEVQEKALELKQQFLAQTKRRVQLGDAPALDTEQAETQLENTLTALEAARQTENESQNLLKTQITDSFRDLVDLTIVPTDHLLSVPPDASRDESFNSALRNRPDLEQARLALEKADVEIHFRRNQLYPAVDAFGHYGGQGVGEDLSGSTDTTLHFRNPVYWYGVVLSMPLSNLKERSDYHASKAFKEMAQLQLQKAEQSVLLDVANALTRVQSRFAQVGSTRKARQFAESALAAEEKKLSNGLTTTFVVLQLQETLTAARTAEVLALADYNNSLAQLDFARGTMLERHKLAVELK